MNNELHTTLIGQNTYQDSVPNFLSAGVYSFLHTYIQLYDQIYMHTHIYACIETYRRTYKYVHIYAWRMIRHLCAACNIRDYLFMYCVRLRYHCVCLSVTDFPASKHETESVIYNSFCSSLSMYVSLHHTCVCSLSLFNTLCMCHPLCLNPMCVCIYIWLYIII